MINSRKGERIEEGEVGERREEEEEGGGRKGEGEAREEGDDRKDELTTKLTPEIFNSIIR